MDWTENQSWLVHELVEKAEGARGAFFAQVGCQTGKEVLCTVILVWGRFKVSLGDSK